jgi:hypothetical protein
MLPTWTLGKGLFGSPNRAASTVVFVDRLENFARLCATLPEADTTLFGFPTVYAVPRFLDGQYGPIEMRKGTAVFLKIADPKAIQILEEGLKRRGADVRIS